MQHDAIVRSGGSTSAKVLSRLSCWAGTQWIRFWRWRSLNATVAVMHGLDDRMLKDIGIDRSEIESIAYTSGAERRRRYVEMVSGSCRG
jgi:uncharacterized protein YjiS (DUF1127 family)